MSKTPPRPRSTSSIRAVLSELDSSKAFRELLDSLTSEQLRNQDLLLSLGFALRSFTNLHRFLDLVPVVVSRLVGVDGVGRADC